MLRKQIALGAAALFVAGCTSDQPTPTAFEVRAPLFAMGGNSASNLGTHLTGDEEVLPDMRRLDASRIAGPGASDLPRKR